MAEAIRERVGVIDGPQTADKGPSGFEPEVLAFCCEH